MPFSEALGVSAKNCLVALLAGAFFISLLLAVGSTLLLKQGYVDPFTVLIAPIVAFIIGVVPVLLFGIPAYAALLFKGWANYITALMLGVIPALLLLPLQSGAFSLFFAIYGPPIALLAHFLSRRQLRSNYSFQRTLIR